MISRVNSKEEIDGTTTSMSFRHGSIRSSISSLYRNYDFHFDILKLTGVVVLLSIMSATLAITSNIHIGEKPVNISDCIRLRTTDTKQQQLDFNSCSYIKQFRLPEEYYVTICRYQGVIRIDVRKFLNDRPTIQGFFLNTNQYRYLKRLISHIDESISSARARS